MIAVVIDRYNVTEIDLLAATIASVKSAGLEVKTVPLETRPLVDIGISRHLLRSLPDDFPLLKDPWIVEKVTGRRPWYQRGRNGRPIRF